MLRASLAVAAVLAAAPAQQGRPPQQGRPQPGHPQQGHSQQGPIRTDASGLVLPAGDFTVAELVEATATYLCRNYLYDPSTLDRAGGFTLQRQVAVDALGSEELLYALLSTRDLAVFPVDEPRGIYAIVALEAVAQQGQPGQSRVALRGHAPWRSRDEILRRPNLREIVSTGIAVATSDARALAAMFDAAVPAGWQPGRLFVCARDERFLMLHGYRDQVAQAIRIAELLDRGLTPAREDLLQRIQRLERELAEVRAQLDRR